MDSLFPTAWTDLGRTRLHPGSDQVPLWRVEAKRANALRAELRILCPARPGIYGMVDRDGALLYVGKAKSLRTRLLSYFRPKSRAPKAGRLLRQARSIVWEVWPSEFAALLRELELIRRWRPSWNVQGQPLRRRMTFVCLGRGPAPYVYLSARPGRSALFVFGPVPKNKNADLAVRRVNDWFRLRDCPESREIDYGDSPLLFPETAEDAACIRLEMESCLGPCVRQCDGADYSTQVRAARRFLMGMNDAPLSQLQEAMQQASDRLAFERAAGLRDRLASLRWLDQKLRQIRRARDEMSWVYPVSGPEGASWWYLVHGGRVQGVVDPTQAEDAGRRIEEVYGGTNWEGMLESYEHVDGRLLVDLWFRKHTRERGKTIAPREALRILRGA